jgi:hypothetical protein
VKIEIQDAAGKPVNSYSSDAPAPPAPRGGAGGGDDPDAGFARFRAAPPPRPTAQAGMNRFVWDVRYASGLTAPPGAYQAKISLGGQTLTQGFTVKIDPRIAAEGVTAADLVEQYEHNARMREMTAEAQRAAQRVQGALTRLRGATGAAADTLAKVQAVAGKLLSEPVRYGKPGLQAHISYLASMTTGADQKVGRDALARYLVLRKELDAIIAQLTAALGPPTT